MIHKDNQLRDLIQLAEQWTGDLEVVSANPIADNFWWNLYFLFCVTLDLSDNLT